LSLLGVEVAELPETVENRELPELQPPGLFPEESGHENG